MNRYRRKNRDRQVRRCKYHSEPCTTTVAEDPCNANVKFNYHRVNNYFPFDTCTPTAELDPFL